jgi:outer membrane protein assembly factor BamB
LRYSQTVNWAQWRGSDGTGVSDEKKAPAEWGITKNIKWRTPIAGKGHSSPIVWGDRIFLTTAIEGAVVPGAKAPVHLMDGKEFKHPDSVGADRKHTLKVLCLDRASGKVVWERTAYEGTVYDDRHRKGSFAAPTPATDGSYVFASFGSEGVYCYDFTGKLVWKQSLGQIGTVGMGPGTSPVLYENLVILQ